MDYDEIFKEAEKEVVEKYRHMEESNRRNSIHSPDYHVERQSSNFPAIHVTVNPIINVVSKETQKNSPLGEVGKVITSLLPAFLR